MAMGSPGPLKACAPVHELSKVQQNAPSLVFLRYVQHHRQIRDGEQDNDHEAAGMIYTDLLFLPDLDAEIDVLPRTTGMVSASWFPKPGAYWFSPGSSPCTTTQNPERYFQPMFRQVETRVRAHGIETHMAGGWWLPHSRNVTLIGVEHADIRSVLRHI